MMVMVTIPYLTIHTGDPTILFYTMVDIHNPTIPFYTMVDIHYATNTMVTTAGKQHLNHTSAIFYANNEVPCSEEIKEI